MLTLLIIAAVADFAIAVLLIGVSGFLFGSGPESMHGGAVLLAAYSGAVLCCIAAPLIGFVLKRRGKAGAGVIVAWLPPAGALAALMVPAPY